MNSFESDFSRAVFSVRFLCGVIIEFLILSSGGFESELFKMSVPLICTLPYSCGWLGEYKSGFVKTSLSRSTIKSYILGKFFSCCIAGGLVEVLAARIYIFSKHEEYLTCEYGLLFISAMFWAAVATTLAAMSDSKYVAYGSSFVIYYFLVILHERYWKFLYCLDPYEWFAPRHTWIFDKTGIVLMLTGLIVIVLMIYSIIIRRRLENV